MPLAHEALLIILRIGVDVGNCILGVNPWVNIIKAVYKLDENT